MALTWELLGSLGGGDSAVMLTSGPVDIVNSDAITATSTRVSGLSADTLPAWITVDESAGYSRVTLEPGRYMVFGAMDAAALYSDLASVTAFAFMVDGTFFSHKYYDANSYEDNGAKMFGLGASFRAPVRRSFSVYGGMESSTYRSVKNVGVMVARVADEPLGDSPLWATGPGLAWFDFSNELAGDATELGLVDQSYGSGLFQNLGDGLEYSSSGRPLSVYHTATDVGGTTEQWADVELGIAPSSATSWAGVAMRALEVEERALVCAVSSTSWRVLEGQTDYTSSGTVLISGALGTAPVAGDRIGARVYDDGSGLQARMYVNGVEVGGGPIAPTVALGLRAGVALSDGKAAAGTLLNFRAGGDWLVGLQKSSATQTVPLNTWTQVTGTVRRAGLAYALSDVVDNGLVVPEGKAGERLVTARVTYAYNYASHQVRVKLNGSVVLTGALSTYPTYGGENGVGFVQVSGLVTVDAGDVLTVEFWTDSNFANTNQVSAGAGTYVTVT